MKTKEESGMRKASQEPVGLLKKKDTSVLYQLAMGRLLILKKQYERANEYLSRAMKEDVLVRKTLCRNQF